MSKSMNMLRTRRRDNNVKPNRRLDRKSSRGMIYENEELRLKTININAEIERGQSDIKKLRRENEMLKKEIWCLRDEYEKLDKLLKDKDVDFSSSTCTSDSESCSSCTDDLGAVESTQNLENVQKTNLKNLHVEFDHLSVVPEENSPEGSDRCADVIKPDQSYPQQPVHFFSPLPQRESSPYQEFLATFQNFHQEAVPLQKTSSDIIVKLDNQSFNGTGSFSNGGNLEELLNDIETISKDILEISNEKLPAEVPPKVPYKSELNVVLMPSPMPLIGFEKYEQFKTSHEDFLELPVPESLEVQKPEDFLKVKNEELCTSRSNLLELTSSDHVSSENEENLRFNGEKKPAKMSIRRKVSIHFKGKKDKAKEEEKTHKKTPSLDSKKSADELTRKQNSSTEPKSSGSERNSLMEKKARKSVSISPDRKHHDKKHKKHKKNRRSTISNERNARERSFSVCTDGSAFHPPVGGEEPQSTDRERTNSLSSCNSVRMRKMSNFSNVPVGGKIPWCGCWGNGCI